MAPRDTVTSDSPTNSSMPKSQESCTQDDMNNLIMKELSCATFFVDLTAQDAVFYADSKHVKAVLHRLRELHNLTSNTLLVDVPSSENSPRFPPGGFKAEKYSYKPLTHLLNMIVRATNECLPATPQRYLRHLRFHSYGIEVKENYGSIEVLKPDGVGLVVDLPTGQKISWGQVEVVIEVKNQIPALIEQAATYARCSLVDNQRRSFAIAIGFDHKKMVAWFLVFHRSGLSSSRPLSLCTQHGFEHVVEHIVGMLSIRDEADYGLDMTRSQKIFFINDRYYQFVRLLFMRNSLRGRSTVVYNLEARTDVPVTSMPSRTRRLTLGNKVDALPDQMTYKVSYPVEACAQEGQLFSRFVGHFGIADVLGYHVCGPDELHGSTQRFLQHADFWDVFGGVDRAPEKRSQQCIALSSGGRSLLDLKEAGGIPSPCELLDTILHAIIGHCNLFFGGVLHGDISSGNVLRHAEPVKRPPLERFACTKNVDMCRGFLIDGDRAVEWQRIPDLPTEERWGTLPFVSIRLLWAWDLKRPVVHTAVDDLESFIWLLSWTLVRIFKNNGSEDPGILSMERALSSKDLVVNATKEPIMIRFWPDAAFGDLMRHWLTVLTSVHHEVKQLWSAFSATPAESPARKIACKDLESLFNKVYEQVLDSGFSHREKISRYSKWEDMIQAMVPLSRW